MAGCRTTSQRLGNKNSTERPLMAAIDGIDKGQWILTVCSALFWALVRVLATVLVRAVCDWRLLLAKERHRALRAALVLAPADAAVIDTMRPRRCRTFG